MMKKRFQYFGVVTLLFLSTAVLTSCYTKKPFCDDVYEENGVYHVKEPFYKIKLTVGGGALLAGGTAAGGYVGNNANKNYLDQKYNTANTVIGAAIGLGVTAGLMAIFKPYSNHASDPYQWMNKANNNYAFAGKYSDGFLALPVEYEKSFTPKTLKDIEMYSIAFPNSSYRAEMVNKVTPNLTRKELEELDTYFPEKDITTFIQRVYIMRAKNTCDFINSVNKYPGQITNESEKAKKFLTDMDDVICFNKQYPDVAKTESFQELAVPYVNSFNDLERFRNTFKETKQLDAVLTRLGSKINTAEYCELYIDIVDDFFVNEEHKQIVHEQMFANATSFSDFNHIAKTISAYTEEAILASVDYIKSYDELKTANKHNVLSKSQVHSIIDKTYKNYSFDELIACKSNFPNYPNLSKIADRSVEKAGSISQCKTAADTYPRVEAAANDKAYAYAKGSIPKSEEFLDAFPVGDNALSISISLILLKVDRFNELVSEAETAIANDDYNRSENAINEAKKVMPNNNYVDPLNDLIDKHNSHKNAYLAELEAEIERQRRYEAAQRWEYNRMYDKMTESDGSYTIKVEMINGNGDKKVYRVLAHARSEDGFIGDGTYSRYISISYGSSGYRHAGIYDCDYRSVVGDNFTEYDVSLPEAIVLLVTEKANQ